MYFTLDTPTTTPARHWDLTLIADPSQVNLAIDLAATRPTVLRARNFQPRTNVVSFHVAIYQARCLSKRVVSIGSRLGWGA